jgi:hypothetical protein
MVDGTEHLNTLLSTAVTITKERANDILKDTTLKEDMRDVTYLLWYEPIIKERCIAIVHKDVVRTILTEKMFTKSTYTRGKI